MDLNMAGSTTTPVTGSDDVQSKLEKIIGGTAEEAAPITEELPSEEETPVESTEEEETDEVKEETEEEKDETETEEEAEGLELSLTQVAEVLGADEDLLSVGEEGDLRIKTKVDGVVEAVGLNDLIKSYQTDAHVTRKSQRLADDRREFEQTKTQETQNLHQTVTQAASLITVMEKNLLGEINTPEMAALRQTNPGEWAARQQQIAERQEQIAQAKGFLGDTIKAQEAKTSEARLAQRQAKISEETETLLSKIPAWSDEKVAAKEIGALQDFLRTSYGFSEAEVSNLGDHRLVLLARDAANATAVASSTKETLKKVRAIPKIVKPGAKGTQVHAAKTKKTEQKKIRLKNSGNVNDLTAILLDRV